MPERELLKLPMSATARSVAPRYQVRSETPNGPKRYSARPRAPVPETACDFYPNNPNNPSKVAIIRPKRPTLAGNFLRSANLKMGTLGSSWCSRLRPTHAALVVILAF